MGGLLLGSPRATEQTGTLRLGSPRATEQTGTLLLGSPRATEQTGTLEWRPNSKACEICSTKFTLITRRHHCRACGSCVCSRCSPFKSQLDHPLDRRHSLSSSETFIGDSFLEAHVPKAASSRTHRICCVCLISDKLGARFVV